MINYDARPTAAYAELERPDRIQRINEALFHLVSAASIIVDLAKTELAELEQGNEVTSEAEQANIRMIGANLLHLSTIGSDTEHVIDPPLEESSASLEAPVEPESPAAAPVDMPQEIVVTPRKPKKKTPRQKKTPAGEEQYPIPTNNRHYVRIVPAEEMPSVEIEAEADPIEIHIVLDDTITFNGEEMNLKGDDLYLFNSFMLLRDRDDITAKDLRRLGFRRDESPAGTVALSIAIRTFREKMQDTSGPEPIELISRQGQNNSTTYKVNPVLVKTDLVREGSTVTVDFLDEDEESKETFRIPNRYKQHSPDSSVRLLDQKLPLYSQLLGARLHETVSYETGPGQAIDVKIVGIE